MSMYFDFENAEAFAAGAIGEPGQRTFYLQVRAEGRVVSVKCEKSQVQALSTYLRDMLADMPDTGPALDPTKSSLMNPVEQDFVLGSIGLGVDRTNMRMVVQLEEMVFIDEEDDDDIFDILDDDDDDEGDDDFHTDESAERCGRIGDHDPTCHESKGEHDEDHSNLHEQRPTPLVPGDVAAIVEKMPRLPHAGHDCQRDRNRGRT